MSAVAAAAARALAAALLGLALASASALGQLAKPTNPFCVECASAMAIYKQAWEALQVTLASGAREEAELKAGIERIGNEIVRARHGGNDAKVEQLQQERAKLQLRLDGLAAAQAAARQTLASAKSAFESCIANNCFWDGSVAVAPGPAGRAETCRECAPLADRIADLDRRMAELRQFEAQLAAVAGSDGQGQRQAVGRMLRSLQTARNLRQADLENCREANKDKCPPKTAQAPAAAVDACVVGTWRSETITIAGSKVGSGGDGIVMTIQADGAITMNYEQMTALKGIVGESNQWRGTASGRIETAKGGATITSVSQSQLVNKYTDPKGGAESRPMSGLGPAALGNNPPERAYACDATSLKYQSFLYAFTFKRQR